MAMTTCKECGAKISSRARTCPQCGKRRTSFVVKFVAVFIGTSVLASIYGVSQNAQRNQELAEQEAARLLTLTPQQRAKEAAETARAAEATAREDRFKAVRGACLVALKAVLHDPDSAKIGSTSSWPIEERPSSRYVVTPHARAKNALGAYVNGQWRCEIEAKNGTLILQDFVQVTP